MLNQVNILLAATLLVATSHAENSAFCGPANEAQFRLRLHEDGKFHLYTDYEVLSGLVETRVQEYDERATTIERYQEDAASVSKLLSLLDESFPSNREAIELYNKLSRYDGLSIPNPDESLLALKLPPTTKREWSEKFEKIEEPEARKIELLKLRYSIAALGVYLDKTAEQLRSEQAPSLESLKEMAKQSSRLKWQLQGYCQKVKSISAQYIPKP